VRAVHPASIPHHGTQSYQALRRRFEIEELEQWIRDCKAGRDTLDHTTRMFPARKDEILAGGSLTG
jgi:hypothetical protein